EHRDHITDAQLRVMNAIQCDGTDVREDANARVGAVREQVLASVGGIGDVMRPMSPGAEDALSGLQSGDPAADLSDFTALFITEVTDRVRPARIVGSHEQPALLVPLAMHERI